MNIVVLCGGLSPERDVSLSGGRMITAALRRLGHRAVLVDMYLGLEGCVCGLDEAFDLPLPALGEIGRDDPELERVRASRSLRSRSLFGARVLELCAAADLVFLNLHGRGGEDGRVQAAFDLMGIRYTGSGHLPSALAMDKRLAKLLARSVGVLTPRWRYYEPGAAANLAAVPTPCVVKPVSSGSSLGVEIVRRREELAGAFERAARSGGVLIEDYICGREIQLAVLGGEALPSIEIRPRSGFYDYRSKYIPGEAEELSPAPLPPGAERELASAALRIYAALGLSGLARADFIYDGAGRFWFLEFNTLPGMTATSLAPQEAAAAGLSYEALCERIADLAFKEDNTW